MDDSPLKNGNRWKILTAGFNNKYNFATRGIGLYKGDLYIGTQSLCWSEKLEKKGLLKLFIKGNIIPHLYSSKSKGCEIWRYNDKTKKLCQVVGDSSESDMPAGFGTRTNFSAAFIKEFKGKMYIGTANSPTKGCEIWRYDGNSWENVITGGFGNPNNYGAWTVEEFGGYLYVGTANWNRSSKGFAQIWRSFDGDTWEKVVDRGFRDFCKTKRSHNRYVWSMVVYKDMLYAGTYNHPALLGNKGGQLFRSKDGKNWEKIDLPSGDGFGKAANYGIREMKVYNDDLILGTAVFRPFHGCQLWKYNGSTWYHMEWNNNFEIKTGSKKVKKEPFKSKHEKYAWSMFISSDNKLLLGCSNTFHGGKLFQYDGTQWEQIVENDGEIEPGFGRKSNTGIRSIIEYPWGSKNIIAGTSTSFVIPGICEVWLRKF